MKMNNEHTFFNGLCCGCNAAIKQEDIDPDKLYLRWLCDRCRAELEKLPPRYQTTFDKLKREIEKVAGKVKFLERHVAVLEEFVIAKGLSLEDANEGHRHQPPNTPTEDDMRRLRNAT